MKEQSGRKQLSFLSVTGRPMTSASVTGVDLRVQFVRLPPQTHGKIAVISRCPSDVRKSQ